MNKPALIGFLGLLFVVLFGRFLPLFFNSLIATVSVYLLVVAWFFDLVNEEVVYDELN